MWKWLVGTAAILIAVSLIVSSCYERSCEKQKRQNHKNGATVSQPVPINNDYAKQDAEACKVDAPWWYKLLAWPDGITALALILTLIAITGQAHLMREHAGTFARLARIAAKSNKNAVGTLDALKRQTELMEQQAGILGESVTAAKDSAKAANDQIKMMKDKERARLEIEIDKFEYAPNVHPFFLQKVNWRVRLHGQSEAFILNKRMIACIGEPKEHSMFNLGIYEMAIRDVLTPTERIAYGTCLISPTSTTIDDVGSFDLDGLKERKGILYCTGQITFKDVFGDCWTLPFRRRWAYELFGSDQMDSDGWGGEWMQEGDNQERQVRQDSQ